MNKQTDAPARPRITIAEAREWAKADPATWAKVQAFKRNRPPLSKRQRATIGRTLKAADDDV